MASREIELSLRVYREDGQWVAECDELDVSSCGDSVEEALENIHDAIVVYLTTLEAEGELERVFAERGIRLLPSRLPHAELKPDVLQTALRVPLSGTR